MVCEIGKLSSLQSKLSEKLTSFQRGTYEKLFDSAFEISSFKMSANGSAVTVNTN